jgi:hypothetical protein
MASELEKRSFGTLQRLEHQVLWELDYSGLSEELAERKPRSREKRFDEFWDAFSQLVRGSVLKRADECATFARAEARFAARRSA